MPVDQTKTWSGDRTSDWFGNVWIHALTGNMT
jgi:hypothetical protein